MSLNITLSDNEETVMYEMLEDKFQETSVHDTEKMNGILSIAKRCGLHDLHSQFVSDLRAEGINV